MIPIGRLLIGGLALFVGAASAQEAMHTQAATMPSPGTFVLREMLHYTEFGTNASAGIASTEQYRWTSALQYGVARDWSLLVDVPVMFRDDELLGGGGDSDAGVGDIDVLAKWRFYREDSGDINTKRAALIFGARVASGDDDDFSSQSVNPTIGGVYTVVRGRHGFNQDLFYRLNTGGDPDHNFGGESLDDAILHNSSWVYRLFPARYTSETEGAWYSTVELSGIYEFNGDYEARGSAGFMYEGRRWAIEAMVQLPVVDELDERAELDVAVGFGLRFTF